MFFKRAFTLQNIIYDSVFIYWIYFFTVLSTEWDYLKQITYVLSVRLIFYFPLSLWAFLFNPGPGRPFWATGYPYVIDHSHRVGKDWSTCMVNTANDQVLRQLGHKPLSARGGMWWQARPKEKKYLLFSSLMHICIGFLCSHIHQKIFIHYYSWIPLQANRQTGKHILSILPNTNITPTVMFKDLHSFP